MTWTRTGDAVPECQIETPRLVLIPLSERLIGLALEDRSALAASLHAGIPAAWPNPDYAEILAFLRDRFREEPELARWNFLMLHRSERCVIGELGCKDLPDQDGAVEIGYGVIPSYQGQGYATEAVRALTASLSMRPDIRWIRAETELDNPASIRLLEKVGFHRATLSNGLIQWERSAERV
ncbi:MAG TPA: GNAT family N-acetyltransferase [Thermomicrobiales bacterium]|nr:GNAT family N-acetyltransferase [Thermomicrobiales bacterium]